MKFLTLIGVSVLISVLFPTDWLMAQSNKGDSIFYKSTVDNTITIYQQFTQDQPRLYNGRKYKPYAFGFTEDTPFFQAGHYSQGSIIYEGGYYDKVNLLYDEVKEMVIILKEEAIELINERIGGFTISGHIFVRFISDGLHNNINTGFYEKLYSGKVELYKKERKTIRENLSSTEGVRGDVDKKISYYLKKNGVYFLIKKQNDIIEILSDHQKEIQKFIKQNSLNFRNNPDNTLIQIVAYYDQITQ